MRTSRLVSMAAVALVTAACTAATAVRPPEDSGFSGYDRMADREFRMSPSAAYRSEKKDAKRERDEGMRRAEKHGDRMGFLRRDDDREDRAERGGRDVYSRERVVYGRYDSEEAYRRATLQGDTYHRDGDVPHAYDDDGGDPFHDDGGSKYQ